MKARIRYTPSGFRSSIGQDLIYGLRMLRRAWGVTLAVVFALALGIGANAGLFSVVDAVLLHPLRFENPASLAVVWEKDVQGTLHSASAAN